MPPWQKMVPSWAQCPSDGKEWRNSSRLTHLYCIVLYCMYVQVSPELPLQLVFPCRYSRNAQLLLHTSAPPRFWSDANPTLSFVQLVTKESISGDKARQGNPWPWIGVGKQKVLVQSASADALIDGVLSGARVLPCVFVAGGSSASSSKHSV